MSWLSLFLSRTATALVSTLDEAPFDEASFCEPVARLVVAFFGSHV
jgi:hypothetical protein